MRIDMATLIRRGLGGLTLMLLASVVLMAQQETGSIRGSVTDPSGASVPNAEVMAEQVETGLTRRTRSDAQGNYQLVQLPIGHYRVEASAPGFKKYVQVGVTL
ncbi:MAG TPA: carboxypeptidase-like regulatory domain-containing protein, partial [Terriglobia bacterium]|nr:carboxypeptidase-like regulatory domain-containing protein [Terriglobia bacterium]